MAHCVVEMIMKCMYVKRVNLFPYNECLRYIMRECVSELIRKCLNAIYVDPLTNVIYVIHVLKCSNCIMCIRVSFSKKDFMF